MSFNKQPRQILVTGANRGIGFLVVKKLSETSSVDETIILLGSRDVKKGHDALRQLNSPSNVFVLHLDTSSNESILHAIEEIKQKHGGYLDVIVNNAAISIAEITEDSARQVFATNYYGIKFINEHMIPLMRNNGRIINVSSQVALDTLQECSRSLQEKYTSSELTQTQLNELVEDFISSVRTNNLENLGYRTKPDWFVYGVSKMALNSLTQIETRQWSACKNLLCLSVTPGFCATGMTRFATNARSAELGADSILYVIDTPANQLKSGGFYRDGQLLTIS
ncbi:unnamed protein product [Adineta ricciae]|uniref:Uncharacterized protein n=1 Tax=Adineta ricciae TaxID=249248 RepID=A0A816AZL8_ADIRI|nr:unnamed protein product [Adineta ricciae]CAF1603568.1 unnamed protein product [Adineta ricciae]